MLKYAAVLALVAAAGPAFAQSGATQSPPSPNSGQSAPQAATSVPSGAMTTNPSSAANPNTTGSLSAVPGLSGSVLPPQPNAPGAATVPSPQK